MILLADDDRALRTLGQRILESRGYKVITASSGSEALALYDAHRDRICLSILDITMPDLPGDQVLIEIRAQDPAAAVVLCSGYDPDLFADRIAKAMPTAYLSKPYRIADLMGVVQEALGEPSA